MIKTISPNSPILKKHIECFYFYEGESASSLRYLAFPHFNTGISFFKGASIQRKPWSINISEGKENEVSIEVLGKYTSPIMIEYTGKLQEIAVIFKPLGISRFFRETYHSLAPEFSQNLVNEDWTTFGTTLFAGKEYLKKLELFLLSQYTESPIFRNLEISLMHLGNFNDELSISEIAAKSDFTLKTFQRHFKKHMGCSAIDYRRICRFRNSIASGLKNSQLKTLTDLTYENGYFDQSYFIKEFRKLTTHNPKNFFRVVKKVDGDRLIWEIK